MADRLPDGHLMSWQTFRVEDVEFVCKRSPGGSATRQYIVKPPDLVDRYLEIAPRDWAGGNIVELGIAEGGSTALVALLAKPRKLLAVDIQPDPLPALRDFIDAHGLSASVRPYFGVDQTDRTRLQEILDSEIGTEPIDVVIDDASHLYAHTVSSFETLFPRLRPGGMFIVEDWRADHVMADAIVDMVGDSSSLGYEERVAELKAADQSDGKQIPLTRLAVELLLASASVNDAVSRVGSDDFWLVAHRGSAELDPARFRLRDLYRDHHGFLAAAG